MAGTYFDYQAGRIEATFSHDEEFDYVSLKVNLIGDTTTTTDCDDHGRFAEPVIHQTEPMGFSLYFSSVFCPFKDLIRFLEAIATDVQECGFEWDVEGPCGRMRWHRRYVGDTGFLTFEWQSSKENFRHRTMLNTRQAVEALYRSFRSFVESEDYDPLRYEEISNGEGFRFVLADATLDDLVRVLTPLDFQSVHSAISRLRDTAGRRSTNGPKTSFPLNYFLEIGWSELPLGEWEPWISENWESLTQSQRADDLREMFAWGSLGWSGVNLRELRSEAVESWLSQPEAPARRPFRIPVVPEQSESGIAVGGLELGS